MSERSAGPQILIVDDDELLLMLLEHKLHQRGMTVHTATDGLAGLRMASSTLPDLIVLDGMMPTLDGFECLRHLKQDKDTANIPVIMLSARRLEQDVVNGLRLGAEDYLVKPFIPEELILKIQKILKDASRAI